MPGGWVHPGELVTEAASRHLAAQAELDREVTHTCVVGQSPASATVAEVLTFVCYLGLVEEHRVPAARPTANPTTAADAAWVWPEDLHRLIHDPTALDLTRTTRDAVVQGRGVPVQRRRQAPLLTLPTTPPTAVEQA